MSKDIAVGCITLVVVFVMVFALVAVIFGIEVATAGLVGRGKAHIQIQSAPSRLAAYEYFFNQCASIQSLEAQIDLLQDQLSYFESGSREYSITVSSLTGVRAMRQSAIAEYNQNALKDYTMGQFKDSDLPYQLNSTMYDGVKTVCAVQ